MKKSILLLASSLLMITSCGKKNDQAIITDKQATAEVKTEENIIPYTVAERYFVKNSVESGLKTLKITSKEEFDKYFGAATVMGENGTPTAIDFSNQFVIAIINAESNKTEDISLKSLTQVDNKLKVDYKITTQDDTKSYISRLSLILIVDKKYDKEVEFVKE